MQDIEVEAKKSAHAAYNNVIIGGEVIEMCKQYGIEQWTSQATTVGHSGAMKSHSELCVELVGAIAKERAKSRGMWKL